MLREYAGLTSPCYVIAAAAATTGSAFGQCTVAEDASGVGLIAVHQPEGFAIPGGTRMTGGLCIADFDNDGDQDVFFVTGGQAADMLFINDGTGNFTDQAAAWGLTDLHVGNGCAAGDFNNDGFIDIYVTSYGDPTVEEGEVGANRLYMNNGGTSFTDVATAAGVATTSPSFASAWGCAWGDYDLDGDLDLCTATWHTFAEGNRLFENNGDGTFTDVTTTAIDNSSSFLAAKGFQPSFVDLDGDLYPELVFIADFRDSMTLQNNGDGTFTDVTDFSGTGLDENGMGISIADFDLDQDLDFYVSSIFYEGTPPFKGYDNGQMFYRNQGNLVFHEIASANGTEDGGWGWGSIAIDLDLDMHVDIVQVNGWYPAQCCDDEWLDERARMFYNDGTGMFTDIAVSAGLTHDELGRAIAYMDSDDDGDLDFVIGARETDLQYFENTTDPAGNWIRIDLDSSTNALLAPNGYGALIKVTANGETQRRYVNGNPSYLATSELVSTFGLDDAATIDTIEVVWPRGQVTTMADVAVNQRLTITAPILGDGNGDGVVNTNDLLVLLANWGPDCTGACLPYDTNNDGVIDVTDLLTLIANWG